MNSDEVTCYDNKLYIDCKVSNLVSKNIKMEEVILKNVDGMNSLLNIIETKKVKKQHIDTSIIVKKIYKNGLPILSKQTSIYVNSILAQDNSAPAVKTEHKKISKIF